MYILEYGDTEILIDKGTSQCSVDLNFLKNTIRIFLEQETSGLVAMMHVLVSEKVNNTIKGTIVKTFYNAYVKLTNLRKKMSDKLMKPSAYMVNVKGTFDQHPSLGVPKQQKKI